MQSDSRSLLITEPLQLVKRRRGIQAQRQSGQEDGKQQRDAQRFQEGGCGSHMVLLLRVRSRGVGRAAAARADGPGR